MYINKLIYIILYTLVTSVKITFVPIFYHLFLKRAILFLQTPFLFLKRVKCSYFLHKNRNKTANNRNKSPVFRNKNAILGTPFSHKVGVKWTFIPICSYFK